MVLTRPLAALFAALIFAFPAVALADSAGDQQYQDPFGGNTQQHSKPKKKKTQTTPAPSTPVQTTPTQPSSPSQSQVSGTSSSSSSSSSSPGGQDAASSQLPRTGLDLRAATAIGLLLVGTGVLVRRRRG